MALRRSGLAIMAIMAIGLLGGAQAALASPQDVIADWTPDGRLDGQVDKDPEVDVTYSVGDLESAKALIRAQDPANAPAVIAAIQEVIERDYIGIDPPRQDPGIPSTPRVGVPVWVTAAAIAAGLLVVGGVGSAIYRRARRPAG